MLKIGFVVTEGFAMMGAAAMTVFEYANLIATEPCYELHVLSEKGGFIRSSVGMMVDTEAFNSDLFDTLIVNGGNGADQRTTPELLNFLRQRSKTTRRIASICTGAFILAEAGLLDGKRATTHWYYAQELRTRFPQVRIDEDRIFITDGSIWTSAGMTAGFDLAIAMVEKDLGIEVAQSLAKKLVMHQRRAGGQLQHSELLTLSPKSDRIQNALTYAKQNLQTALSVEQLADVANLSPRQFSRAFRTETGQSPAKAIENLRLESARLMIEQSHHPIQVIAQENGFVDRRRMREAFLRAFGQPPQVFRRKAHTG